MNTGKAALGILAGLATGAILGILLAPDSGKNTRKKIANKGGDYADDVKEKFNTLIDTMKGKYQTIKNEAENIEAQANGKYAAAKADFKNTMS